jgi:hypothetical protein
MRGVILKMLRMRVGLQENGVNFWVTAIANA